MGKHEHTDSNDTKIMFLGPGPALDGEPAANASVEELLEASETGGPGAQKRPVRPMLAAGVLTAAVLSAIAFAGAAGAFTDASPVSAKGAAAGDRPAAANPNGSKARFDRTGKKADKREAKNKVRSHAGLCRAYQSKTGDYPGKALQSTAFTRLIKAAGGQDNVSAYCVRVLAAKEAKKGGDEGNGHGNKNGHGKNRDQRDDED